MLRCREAEKVLLGTFSLTGVAQIWWEAKGRVYWSRRQPVTWKSFKKDMKKSNRKATTNKKAVDFHDLVQGHMTVA